VDEWETTNPNPPFSSRIGRRPGHENRKATTVVGHDTYFPNSSTTTATYDALGRMVEKGVSGTYTQFVYNPDGTSLAVYSGGLTKGTISLPGGSTAVYNASGLNFIRHKDWLGSSRLATTWAHAVYSKEAYAPFGETYNEAGTADRSFTGQDQNVVTNSGGTGVYDYLFRKYDPSAGRWLSPDPAGWNAVAPTYPQSLDRYAYAQNNPMSFTDPSGLDCAYMGNDGTSIESLDQNSNPAECQANGGYWADGAITNFQLLANGGYVFTSLDANLNTLNTFFQGSNANSVASLDVQSYFFNYMIQQQQIQRSQTMWSMSPAQRIYQIALAQPTTCGAGVFAYGGRSIDAGPASGFAGGIAEADTHSGGSVGQLVEVSGGEGVVGGGGRIYSGGNSEPLIFGGVGLYAPGAHASIGEVGYPSGIGGYADGSAGGWEGGAGAYVNITTNAACGAK